MVAVLCFFFGVGGVYVRIMRDTDAREEYINGCKVLNQTRTAVSLIVPTFDGGSQYIGLCRTP